MRLENAELNSPFIFAVDHLVGSIHPAEFQCSFGATVDADSAECIIGESLFLPPLKGDGSIVRAGCFVGIPEITPRALQPVPLPL
jgi:hypothetical protein